MSKPVPIPLPKHPPWMSQILVIRALMAREMATRFGQYKLGLFWMLLEPLLGVIVIGIIIGSLAERSVPEIPYPFFLLNGMLLLKLFTGPMNSAINAIGANQGLLVYPAVKPLDPFLARFLFELVTAAFSFVLFCSISMWIGVEVSLGSLQVLAAGYLLTWLTGCGFGLIFGVAVCYYEEVEKIVQVLQRPLLFISAVLFPTSALPVSTQEMLFLNPLVHNIELSRKALFPHYPVDGANLFYPFVFAVISLSMGATLFHNHRNFLTRR
jgi:capsular polysaccharide transport system permease protein